MAQNQKPQEQKPAAAQAKPVEIGAGDYYLRVKLKHPNQRYRLQNHVVTAKVEKFTLTAKEAKELQMPGARDWIEICTEKQFKDDRKLRDQIAKPDVSEAK